MHWLQPKCQGVPSLLSSRHFFTTHGTGTCMYTITYMKATLQSTWVELASTHTRMWVGSDLGSTRIHRKRVQCGHAQPELNLSLTWVQVAVQTSQAGTTSSHYVEESGECGIPQLCIWNVAVARCYITK